PAEDAVALEQMRASPGGSVRIAVPRFSRIANFDDLDPLRLSPGVTLDIVQPGMAIPGDAALVILPGSKSTIADMRDLRAQGWDTDILAHVRRGGRVLGLCGGYQMLGRVIRDPEGIEGEAGSIEGLGLLDVDTVLGGDKTLTRVAGVHVPSGEAVSGYEMHLGRTQGPDCVRPFATISRHHDGAVSANGQVEGTYLHGIFASDAFRSAYLARLGVPASPFAYEAVIEQTLDELADHMEAHADLDLLLRIARGEHSGAAALRAEA
ncbi:MAG: cobyric acid synthase CobQ, partial [Alphaproteobacteria bacterium]